MSSEPERQSDKRHERNPPPRPRKSVIVHMFRALKRYENRRRRKTEAEQHQINERMMARWARWVGLFTGALFLVGVFTAVILYETDQPFAQLNAPSSHPLSCSLKLTGLRVVG